MSKLIGDQQFDGDVYIDGAMGYEIGGDTDAASPVNEALNKLAAVDRRPMLYTNTVSEIDDYFGTYRDYPDISLHPLVYFEDSDEWGFQIEPNYSDEKVDYFLSQIESQFKQYLENYSLPTDRVLINAVYKIYGNGICLDSKTMDSGAFVFVICVIGSSSDSYANIRLEV